MINLILSLILAHFLGDFIFQSQNLSNQKEKYFKSVILHSLVYSIIPIIITAIYFFYFNDCNYLWILIIPLSHFVIDSIKFCILKCIRKRQDKQIYKQKKESINGLVLIYGIDQVLHFLIIFLLLFLKLKHLVDFQCSILTNILSWLTLFVALSKPANITFRLLFFNLRQNCNDYFEFNDIGFIESGNKTTRTGGLIGTLERILIVTLISFSQWATIGLLFTGKSITRYQKIRTDEGFADYFLIGNIYTVLISIATYYLIFKFFPIIF